MRTAAALAALAALAITPAATADSFTPVTFQVHLGRHARRHKPLKISVKVQADAGVLDPRSGPIRVRVKLARALCGADFASTVGTVMLNKALKPQPKTGQLYAGRAKGKARPRLIGTHPLCVFITDDYEVFASDTTSYTVKVRK